MQSDRDSDRGRGRQKYDRYIAPVIAGGTNVSSQVVADGAAGPAAFAWDLAAGRDGDGGGEKSGTGGAAVTSTGRPGVNACTTGGGWAGLGWYVICGSCWQTARDCARITIFCS